eukprot:scaffold10550_cov271-Chaetoceros_neogracile.AAC.61
MGIKTTLKDIHKHLSSSSRKKSMLSSPSNRHSSSPTNNLSNSAIFSTSPNQIQSAYAGRKEFSKEGNINFRILAFAGGLSVLLTSSLSIAICIAHLGILEMITYMYTFLFGVLICILEGQFIKNESVNNIRNAVLEGLPILKYLWGRGVLYMLSGSLQLSHISSMSVLSGAFLIAVGFLFVVVGMNTRRRLKKLKRSLKDVRVLKRHFNRFDRDGDGVLDMDEFGAFVANLTGEDMDEDELEGTFGVIDTQGKEYVTLEELQSWLKGYKKEEENEETGGTGNTFQLM